MQVQIQIRNEIFNSTRRAHFILNDEDDVLNLVEEYEKRCNASCTSSSEVDYMEWDGEYAHIQYYDIDSGEDHFFLSAKLIPELEEREE
jgi:hypothetical protein